MKLFCKQDPLVEFFQKQLKANLLAIPEAKIQVLGVIEQQSQKVHKYQTKNIANILSQPTDLDVDKEIYVEEKAMANISGTNTTKTSIEFGLKVLKNFLKGFGVTLPSLESHFKTVQTVSFSFNNVKRRWADNGLLGGALENQGIKKNPATAGFFGDNASKLLLIDSIIVSNNFSIHVVESEDNAFSFDSGAIADIMEGVNAKVTIETTDSLTLSFKGEDPLPFAFTCLELGLDQKGKIIKMPPYLKHIPTVMSTQQDGEFAKTLLESKETPDQAEDSLDFFNIVNEE